MQGLRLVQVVLPLAVIQPGVRMLCVSARKMTACCYRRQFGFRKSTCSPRPRRFRLARSPRSRTGLRLGARHVFNVPVRHVAVSSEFSQSSFASTVPTVAPGGGAGRATITTGIDSARAAAILA